MPEGDTVYRAAAKLDRALTGHVLTPSDFRVPQHSPPSTSASGTVIRTLSRGKHLLTRIDHQRAWTLHTHLKMEGSLARLPRRRAVASPRHPGTAGARHRGAQGRRLPARHRRARAAGAGGRPGGPPRSRPARPRLGRGARPSPTSATSPAGRSDRRCSTSATSPASATCTWPSCASPCGVHPASARRRRSTDLPRLVRRGQADARGQQGAGDPVDDRRPPPARADVGLPSRQARRAAGAARRSRSRCWASSVASARPTGAPAASPSAEPERRGRVRRRRRPRRRPGGRRRSAC